MFLRRVRWLLFASSIFLAACSPALTYPPSPNTESESSLVVSNPPVLGTPYSLFTPSIADISSTGEDQALENSVDAPEFSGTRERDSELSSREAERSDAIAANQDSASPAEKPGSEKITEKAPTTFRTKSVIGTSLEGRLITSYQFGSGPQKVVFVGGIHGGYEWNTILLAYQAIDYFTAHQSAVPENVSLIIIPSANPDGLFRVTGKEGRFEAGDLAGDTTSGRFNGRDVDLNRNWDCNWSPSALWQNQPVSGGVSPFSEPESRALRDFFLEQQPEVVVFWHSKAGGVYGAGCTELFQITRELAEVYAAASGYPAADHFGHYEISGDAGDWLSVQGIPSITVELATHDLVEWPENLAGLLALLDYFDRPQLEMMIQE